MEILVLLGAIAFIALYGISIYNKLVLLQQNRKNAFSDIDVQLKQRFDMIPALLEIVKGYAAHEKSTLENVTAARAGIRSGEGASADRLQAEHKLGGALVNLFAVAENYPDLKADANFQRLMAELADIENKIAAARRFFNNATAELNTKAQQFPDNIIAGFFGFKSEEFYEDTAVERTVLEQAPNIKF